MTELNEGGREAILWAQFFCHLFYPSKDQTNNAILRKSKLLIIKHLNKDPHILPNHLKKEKRPFEQP